MIFCFLRFDNSRETAAIGVCLSISRGPGEHRRMSSGNLAEISVIIPSHQRRSLVLRVLQSLADQDLDLRRFEVIVVCDGCSDGTAEAIREAITSG